MKSGIIALIRLYNELVGTEHALPLSFSSEIEERSSRKPVVWDRRNGLSASLTIEFPEPSSYINCRAFLRVYHISSSQPRTSLHALEWGNGNKPVFGLGHIAELNPADPAFVSVSEWLPICTYLPRRGRILFVEEMSKLPPAPAGSS